jgi:hypothetical protein
MTERIFKLASQLSRLIVLVRVGARPRQLRRYTASFKNECSAFPKF